MVWLWVGLGFVVVVAIVLIRIYLRAIDRAFDETRSHMFEDE